MKDPVPIQLDVDIVDNPYIFEYNWTNVNNQYVNFHDSYMELTFQAELNQTDWDKTILIDDEVERENAETIGYYAMFEYTNGFRKAMYWSKAKMEKHALKYSKGYAAKKGYTFWEKDFDGMAYKTMLRQLISKWGIMSTEMQEVLEKDMAVIKQDGTYEYVDNEDAPADAAVIQQDEAPIENVVVEQETLDDFLNEVNINEL